MKKKIIFLIRIFLFIGIILTFTSGCKKEDDSLNSKKHDWSSPVKTLEVTNITATSITCNCEIIKNDVLNGIKISESGVCYCKFTNSGHTDIYDNKTNDGLKEIGTWTSKIDSLMPDTYYLISSYIITNDGGVLYGEELKFETLAK